MADRPVPVVAKQLRDVKLSELGTWSAGRDFSPSGIFGAFRRGRDRYYNHYVNVKKGGIGGITIMLVAYVVLSYRWQYEHLKQDRWRKHH
ncbi:ATP synthase subunit f, mitochondrial [Brachionichthys hirsutus]|uniref:ATP synthase subunit f, mitochondrial n=1 Tax=Brachionichthys hirsutus TaxID=412623 RepID=UPI00360475D5